jgi:hypothetical protein
MSWRSWAVACVAAGVTGGVLGGMGPHVTAPPVGPGTSAAVLPAPVEQNTSVRADASAPRLTSATPTRAEFATPVRPEKSKPAKAVKALEPRDEEKRGFGAEPRKRKHSGKRPED